MRGIHLYAALLGTAIVAIAVAYTTFLLSQEDKRVSVLIELDKRSKFIPITDIIREESFTSTAYVFRAAIQHLLARYPVEVSEEGEDELERFLKDEDVQTFLASLLYAELRSYYYDIYGREYDIEFDTKIKNIQRVLDNLEIKSDERGIHLVFDPSQFRGDIPSIKLCKGGMCRVVPIFPDERVKIYIPLRWKKAREIALDVWEEIRENADRYFLYAGFCKGYSVCGIWKGDQLLYPSIDTGDQQSSEGGGSSNVCEAVADLREGIELYLKLEEGEKPIYRALGIYGGGCVNMGLLVDSEEGRYIRCTDIESLKAFAQEMQMQTRDKVIKNEDGENWEIIIEPDFEYYEEISTGVIIYQDAISLGEVVNSAVGGFLSFLFNVERTGIVGIPGGRCEVVGTAKCWAPGEKYLIITVIDPNMKYSSLPFNAVFKFRFHVGKGEKGIEEKEIDLTASCDDVQTTLRDRCEMKDEEIRNMWGLDDDITVGSDRFWCEIGKQLCSVTNVKGCNLIPKECSTQLNVLLSPSTASQIEAYNPEDWKNRVRDVVEGLEGYYNKNCLNMCSIEGKCKEVKEVIDKFYRTNMLLRMCENVDNVCEGGKLKLFGLFGGNKEEELIKTNILSCSISVLRAYCEEKGDECIKQEIRKIQTNQTLGFSNTIFLSYWKRVVNGTGGENVVNGTGGKDFQIKLSDEKVEGQEFSEKDIVFAAISIINECKEVDSEECKRVEEVKGSDICNNPEKDIGVDLSCTAVKNLGVPIYLSTFNYNIFSPETLSVGCYYKGNSS